VAVSIQYKRHNGDWCDVEKDLKGRVHSFSMQVVINKCFLLNLETLKNFGADPSCHFRENLPLIPKNDVTEPKASLL